jgi:hypothetical protein
MPPQRARSGGKPRKSFDDFPEAEARPPALDADEYETMPCREAVNGKRNHSEKLLAGIPLQPNLWVGGRNELHPFDARRWRLGNGKAHEPQCSSERNLARALPPGYAH